MTWYNYNKRGVLAQPAPADPIPVGTITMFVSVSGTPSTAVQAGWLLCNGAIYSSATYPLLYQVLTGLPAPLVPVNFSIPSLDTKFPFGASPTRALKGSDTSTPRTSHDHGGTSTNTHQHTFSSHTHTLANHGHSYGHNHSDNHAHGVGTYITTSPVGGDNAYEPDGIHPIGGGPAIAGQSFIAKGVGSGDQHEHIISGTVNTNTDAVFSNNGYTAGSSGTLAAVAQPGITVDASGTGLTTPSPILPPYINVYFIVKAVDFSGTYI